jgi:succinyl-diaminopimelate desuccinylase
LGKAGFAAERPVFSAPGTPDVQNLYARIGADEPCLVFAGHTDVVGPGEVASWRHDPFAGVIENGLLYGRGAADMKGGIAAMVTAAIGWVEERGSPPKGAIAFLITGDEEGPAVNGTVKLLEWARERGESFGHCVLGEPTNPERLGDMVKIGRRGSINAWIAVDGKQGHVAYPHRAANPIPVLVDILSRLQSRVLDEGYTGFQPSNLEVTTVDVGNTATNVIPASAKARVNIRFNPAHQGKDLAAWIERECIEAAEGFSGRVEALCKISGEAFLTAPGDFTDVIVAAVGDATGRVPELSTTGGTSDARFIRSLCPVVEFGLVGSTMHQVDERVPVEEIRQLAGAYEALINRYFAAFA